MNLVVTLGLTSVWGPGDWGSGLLASPQLTGPGELGGIGCAPALETSSVVMEVSVQVDLLEGNLLGAYTHVS